MIWSAFLNWSRRDALEENSSRLVQASAAMSAFHSWLVPYARSLKEDPAVVRLFMPETPPLYDMVQGLDRLDTAFARGWSLHSLYLYNGQAGFNLSTSYGLQGISEVDPEIQKLSRESAAFGPYRYVPLVLGMPDHPLKVLSLLVGESPGAGRPLTRTLIVNVNTEKLMKDFLAGLEHLGTFIILDSSGQELFRKGESRQFETLAGVFSGQGHMTLQSDSGLTGVCWLHNEDLDWWLILESSLAYSSIMGESRYTNILFLILLLMGISLAVTYRAAFGLYRPVLALIPYMSGSPSFQAEQNSVYSEISQSLRLLGHRLEKEQERRYREMLRDYLEDNLRPEEKAELILRIPELLDKEGPWRVVAVSVYDFKGHSSGNVEYLIFGKNDLDLPDVLEPFLASGRTAGIGNEANTTAELPRSARQARTALGYCFHLGTGRSIAFSCIADDPEEPYDLPIRSVRRMLEKLNTGKSEAAEEVLGAILEDLRNHRPEDFHITSAFMAYELRRDLLPLSESDASLGMVVEAFLEEAIHAETLESARKSFTSIFEAVQTVQTTRSEQKDGRAFVIVDQVRLIMDRDLGNASLCPDSIASEIGISTSYLRTLFRQVAGQSLSRAIQDRRISKCRHLLAQTELSVKEIAEASGYRNYNSFFSTFRRIVGLTPLEFRELNQKRTET